MRLEGKAKGGYYPTPEPIIESIANFLKVTHYASFCALDPCCGTGRALALLTERLRQKKVLYGHGHRMDDMEVDAAVTVTTYGIEPEGVRARAATKVLDEVLTASYFGTTISNESFQCCLLNPPYDLDYEAGTTGDSGSRKRLELSFLERTTQKLCYNAILVYIIPQNQLRAAARHLAEWYTNITCYRFPDTLWASPEELAAHIPPTPMYDRFKQVVLFAQRRSYPKPPDASTMHQIEVWECIDGECIDTLPTMPAVGREYTIPRGYTTPKAFSVGRFDPDRIAEALCPTVGTGSKPGMGIWARREYMSDHWPESSMRGLAIGRPLAPLKNGHLAVLAVAGIANGALLEGKDGRQVMIKGYSSKVPSRKVEEDEEAITETITDKFSTALWGVDMKTGTLFFVETGGSEPPEIGVPYDRMPLSAFMENFGLSLTARVAEANPPLYTGEERLPWAKARFAKLLRQPLGRQRDFILFIVNALVYGRDDDSTITQVGKIAEMATGKTFLSLATAYLADERVPCFPMLVLCPPILARKWKREAEQTIPNARVVIVRQLSTEADANEFREFDPTFHGKELSSVGCMERVIAKIERDLAAWQRDMEVWEEECRQRSRARKHWKATIWWEWKQTYVPGAWMNPAEPHEPEWLPKERPRLEKPLHLVIMTSSTAKLGMEWEPVYTMGRLPGKDDLGKVVLVKDGETHTPVLVPYCCSCMQPLRKKNAKGDSDEDEEEVLGGYLSERDLAGSGESRKKLSCSNCGAVLWQTVAGKHAEKRKGVLPLPTQEYTPPCVTSTAKRRVALADYLRKRHKGFFQLFIPDEIHEGADGTALHYARRSLAQACKRGSGLTGTLCNGYSSSVFPTFYSINPSVRQDFAHDEVSCWIDLYGVRQKVMKSYKDKEGTWGYGAVSKRRIGKPTIREMPGFAPQGLKYVLDCCAFLELADVAPYLPQYKEEVRVIPMDTALEEAYGPFEATITQELRSMLVKGDKSGLAPWFQALLGYPNLPYLGWTCMVKKTGQILGIAPELPETTLYAKERALIDLVQEERNKGRRVLVYAEHTGSFDILSRLQCILEKQVKGEKPLKVTKLYADTVSTIDREQWLRDQVKLGCEVLVCNPKLVKVGLDLIEFPTIVFYEVPTSTSDMRQASRRSHRPGQTKQVKVIHLTYPTMESRLLRLMAKKMKSSLMVEGQLPGEGLVSFGAEEDEGDIMLQLAREVLSGMEQGNLKESTMQDAQALQAMFLEAAQIEQEQNGYLGGVIAPNDTKVEIEEITTIPLSPDPLSTSEDGEPAQSVVVIPLSRIQDPWEPYRKKLEELAKGKKGGGGGKKKGVTEPVVGGLW